MKTFLSILLVVLISGCSGNDSGTGMSEATPPVGDIAVSNTPETVLPDADTPDAAAPVSDIVDTDTPDTVISEAGTPDNFGPAMEVNATTSLEPVGPITLIPTVSLTDNNNSISRIALSPDNRVLTLKSFQSGSSEVRLDLFNTDTDTLSPLGVKDEFVSAAVNAEATSLVYVTGCLGYLRTYSESTEPLLLNSFLNTDTCVRTGTLDMAADTVLISVSPGRRTESGELVYDNDRGDESSYITYTRSNNRVVSFAKSDLSLNDAELDAMDWEMSIPRLSNDGKIVVFHALFQHNASSGTGEPIIGTFATETETGNTTIIAKRKYNDLDLCPRCIRNPNLEPVISANGRYVFFQQAKDAINGVSSKENPGLYRFDLQTGVTADLNIEHAVTALVSNADGNRVAYVSGNDVMVRYIDSNEEINLSPAMRFCSKDPCEIIAHYFVHKQPIQMNADGSVLFITAQFGATENITANYFHEQQLFDLDKRELKRLVPNLDLATYVASSEGRTIYFATDANNLVQEDTDGNVNLFYIERTQ